MYQNRTAYIDELNTFINCSKNSFNNVLKTINWTKQSLLSVKEVEPFQNSEDKPVADNNISPTQEGILLEGGGDHLYNDIVASLLVTDQPIKTDKKDVKTEDKAAALIQLLKMERDAKRRRISYKNKVHTKNKSHTEVLREVLEEQMLTITEVSGNDSAVATNDRLPPSLNQAQELIAIRQPQGNPHLAWLDILEKAESDKKRLDQARAQKSEHSSHNKYSVDQKETCRNEEEKERKKHRKSRKRKEEDNGKHRGREKKNEWDDMDKNSSPNHEDRHHKKKKKKRSRSRSPKPEISDHHRYKSKHKKKKH